MGWIMEKNVNTELEQIGVSMSDGVIPLFHVFFFSLIERSYPLGYVYSLLLIL